MLEKNPKAVKLVFKNFPLNKHRYAIKAATAALAADKQGKFWEFHERLFKNYKDLNDAKIQEIAKELALDIDKFNTDMKDPEIQNLIFRDIRDARKVGVRGIPTVFIDGKLMKTRMSLRSFQQIIDAELKKGR